MRDTQSEDAGYAVSIETATSTLLYMSTPAHVSPLCLRCALSDVILNTSCSLSILVELILADTNRECVVRGTWDSCEAPGLPIVFWRGPGSHAE